MAEQFAFRKMSQLANQRVDPAALERGVEVAGMFDVGGVDIAPALILEDEPEAIKAGVRIRLAKLPGQIGEMRSGERSEGEGGVGDRLARGQGMPFDWKAEQF